MTNTITKAKGIHSGAVTHHHDQSIVPTSFKTKNIRNSAPPKPIPPELALLLIDFLLVLRQFIPNNHHKLVNTLYLAPHLY